MKFDLDDAKVVEGIAQGVQRYLAGTQLAEQIAEHILAQVQFLTPDQAASVLRLPERTFLRKVNEEKLLSKVTLLGVREPRYLLAEVIDQARATVVKRLGMKDGEEPRIIGLRKKAA